MRWVISEDKDYTGEWRVEEGAEPFKIYKGDRGLVAGSAAKKHAISAKFVEPLDNKNKNLAIQYELRLQNELTCGGAYIKLLTLDTLPIDMKTFNNSTPYTIMFGPDKCGNQNDKVHFIVRFQNPISKEYEEKHMTNPPKIGKGTHTHLYTLWIRSDNDFEIFIDQESVKKGNLLRDFEPPFNPPKEIDDPEDKKPEDWVDEVKIVDPDATKPDDWDETQPSTIVDVNDKKPEGWLDNEPMFVSDPETKKPNDWDDELDGEWEAPKIPNVVCDDVGCGEWKPRSIPNPAYKGKWSPPMIDNPKYKGEWKPKKIPNPHYFYSEVIHNFDRIGALGIEIWTMTEGILFDNFIVSYNKAEADEFASLTWLKRHNKEKFIIEEEMAKSNPGTVGQTIKTIRTAVYNISLFASDPDNLVYMLITFIVFVIVPLIICITPKRHVHQKNPVKEEIKKDIKEKIDENREKLRDAINHKKDHDILEEEENITESKPAEKITTEGETKVLKRKPRT